MSSELSPDPPLVLSREKTARREAAEISVSTHTVVITYHTQTGESAINLVRA